MRLFDRLRGVPPPPGDNDDNQPSPPPLPPSPAEEDLLATRVLLDQNEPAQALARLTGGFEKDAAYRPLYALAAQCLRTLNGETEAVLFDAASQDFMNFQPFFDLGYHFIEVEHFRLAIPFLVRAHQLAPDSPLVASELAIAYTNWFQPQKGRDVLRPVLFQANFWQKYEFYWCCLLCNSDKNAIAQYIADANQRLSDPNLSEDDAHGPRSAIQKLAQCFSRLTALGNDLQPNFVRDWHFIQYGAALLDFFDDRTDPNGLEVAGGRYVALWGSLPSIAGVLHKLVRFLQATNRSPQTLLYLPERDSEIIGLALGTLLGLPTEEADETNVAGPNPLIVAADNRLLGDYPALYQAFPNQTVFALNVHWTENSVGATPDVGGLMSQSYYFPWRGGAFSFDPETRETQTTPEDTRPSFAIAADLAAAEGEPDPAFDADHLPFYVGWADFLTGAKTTTPPDGSAQRLRFNSDSPVPGAYFY